MKKSRIIGFLSGAVFCALMFSGAKPVEAAEPDGVIADGVYIGNVNVGGMNEEQARSAVDVYVQGLLHTNFTLRGENGEIEMTAADMGVAADADSAVETALQVGQAGSLINRYKTVTDLKKEPLVLDMHLSVDKQATAQKLYDNAGKLSIEAEDNTLVRENGAFRFVPGKEGVEVDIVESMYAINDFLAAGWDGSNNEIDLVSEVIEPRGSEEELSQIQDLLGSCSTDFSSSGAGRAKNVSTGCSKVNGTILYPGEEFELSPTIRPFTKENGYELAGAYENGTVVESFGGGICQVATTLYNAVIRAELDVTMRYNHSMQVSYVKPSMDAAIAGDYKDLHFKNNYDTPIYIEGYCSGRVIYFNIYGKETRPANREVTFESETVSTSDMVVEFKMASGMPVGYWHVDQSPHIGLSAQLWKIVKVDGEVESRELFNKSTYQSSPKIITIGTAGLDKDQLARLRAAVKTGNESTVKGTIAALKKELEKPKEDEDEEDEEVEDGGKDDGKDDQKDDEKDDNKDNKDDKKDNKDNKDNNNDKKDDQKDEEPSGGDEGFENGGEDTADGEN